MTTYFKKPLHEGQIVVIKHDQGLEIGEISSINYKTGKVDIFFNYQACPHYCTFNLDQIVESVSKNVNLNA